MMKKYLQSFDWADTTRERYAGILSKFLADIPEPSVLDAGALLAWVKSHDEWGSSSQALALSVVRGFIAWNFGASHPALSARLKRHKPKIQRFLDLGEVERLLASFDTSKPKGRRDLAMAALFLDAGLRVSELARLDLRHLDLARCRLDVIIKGGDWGAGVFSEITANFLFAWLADRDHIASQGVFAVFVSTHRHAGYPMRRGSIGRLVSSWGAVAQIGRLSPHDFRRTFATLSTRFGAPARVLQEAGRWRSPEMIDRYTPGITQDDFRSYFPVRGAMGEC